MSNKSNMEGIEVPFADLYKNFIKLKQGNLLSKSKFIIEKIVPKDIDTYMRQYFGKTDDDEAMNEEHVQQLICGELAKHIYETIDIKKENRGDVFAYKMEVLVLGMGELKHIIDYVVKSLTPEQIERIKNEVVQPPQQ